MEFTNVFINFRRKNLNLREVNVTLGTAGRTRRGREKKKKIVRINGIGVGGPSVQFWRTENRTYRTFYFPTASVPLVAGRHRLGRFRRGRVFLQRRNRAVREPYADVLHSHVGRQKVGESGHAVPRNPVERISHGLGVRVTGVTDTAIARGVVARLSVRLSVLHLRGVHNYNNNNKNRRRFNYCHRYDTGTDRNRVNKLIDNI